MHSNVGDKSVATKMDIEMTSIWKIIIVAGAVMTVTGCNLSLTQQLYTSDLLDLADGEIVDVSAPMTMQIPIQNADECEEATTSMSLIVSGLLTDFFPRRCERVRMDNYLIADTQIPVTFVSGDDRDKSIHSFATEVFNVVVTNYFGVRYESLTEEGALPPGLPNVVDPGLAVYVVVNLDKIELLQTRLEDEFPFQNIDLSESTVSIELNNDVRNTMTFSVRHVFMEDDPVQNRRFFELDRRHAATFSLSNVAAAGLMRDGFVPAMILHTEG